ncbi:uncharacterized protein PHALS_14721 [Plasmopara halstedii]|uniref:Uncharacterized protein n=1 Tax=Plasmopara halstedii TaxID=4781 RepID=A0A0P1A3R9_PLAHL|nr:uncharacterized protein PHALS_14721 [Plasmopara halstedii]CEG35095.1 hypothetical protein PHALS_14721 [Plasmopara halstedii]|eukprot:XP_024571464.1 hypothetical protein PHALS_14721 [Plasmopara halstedii]
MAVTSSNASMSVAAQLQEKLCLDRTTFLTRLQRTNIKVGVITSVCEIIALSMISDICNK